MFSHNLLIIIRNFKRSKGSFLINLLGLSTGLACALLIFLWVRDEVTMDKYHAAGDRLFELMEYQKNSESNIRVTSSTPGLLAEKIASDIPEVEYSATVTPNYWFDPFQFTNKEKHIATSAIYAGKDFFKIFSYDLIEGSKDNVLTDKQSVVLSVSTARALFGDVNAAVGKSVDVDRTTTFMVSGVFKDIPTNSSARFDAVFSFEKWKELTPGTLDWRNAGPMTFATLRPGANLEQFQTKIKDIISTQITEKHRSLFAVPFTDLYLHGNYDAKGVQSGGRIEYVIMFSLIACFILAIACVNFMNLSTARAAQRVKEVGIKKAVGAGRFTLVSQFMIESMFMSFLSLLVAVLLVDLLLPQFNVITGKQLDLQFTGSLTATLAGIALLTGLISGSYPALYMSAFNPAAVLKGKLHSTFGELMVRKGLVVFQFSLSVVFIVAVLVVYSQIQYLQHKDIGYDRDNLLYFQMKGNTQSNREAFIQEASRIPGVVGVSTISESLVGGGNTTSLDWEGKDPNDRTPFAVRPVNYGMLELLNLHVTEGRLFSREHQDSINIVVNEAAIRAMGMKDPVGKTVTLGPFKPMIVGVVRDFHYESLHSSVAPMFFILAPMYTQKVMAKLAAGDPHPAIERLQKLHKEFNPEFPFEFRFVDEDYNAQYNAELRVSMLSRYFAGIAIIISCLGLFGLASHTAERRFKEIGIRKALGSSNIGIIYLLSSDFTKVVALAIVIAIPVSFLVLRKWLDSFVFKIELEWWYFIGSGVLALVIAWLTVASQAAKASRINPVKCLRSE
ncbi:MAG: ABC transporter permease [Chryseolinea sp.]